MNHYKLPDEVVWHADQLHRALPQLVKQHRHFPALTEGGLPELMESNPDNETITNWLERVSEQAALEFKETEAAYPDLEHLLQAGAPALLQLPEGGDDVGIKAAFLLLVRNDKHTLSLLCHDGSQLKVANDRIREILASPFGAQISGQIRRIAEQIASTQKQQDEIAHVLLNEQLADVRVKGVWLIRVSPGDGFFRQIFQYQIPLKVTWIMGLTIVAQIFSLAAWFQINQSTTGKSIESINIQIWALLLLTLVPVQLASTYIRNRMSLSFGMLVRNRLLHGVLKLKPGDIREKGSSFFFSTLMNIESLEVTGLSLALTSLLSMVQLGGALLVLLSGAGGASQGVLLFFWIILILILVRIDYKRMNIWTEHQQVMAADLIERMTGHRTRLVQENPNHRHQTEDEILSRYSLLSKSMDAISVILDVVASRRGWLVVSLAGLVHVYFSNKDMSLMLLSLGGIMLAANALDGLKNSLQQFLGALIGWRQVSFIYNSGKQEFLNNSKHFITTQAFHKKMQSHSVIKAENISFSYEEGSNKILDGCSLKIEQGDKILLEGSSGAGKSTVASLLAGMMQPQSGKISLLGTSLEALGEKRWHKHVVISPQFHENYVLSDSFAFNLLMGRNWPPTEEDMAEAEAICIELGLGELLEKMPAGMQQMVGESGWRLSHGEKSRLFIARTLLQKASLIILDESFAALDPETLQIALPCVMKRSNALLLIAHP